MALLALPFFDTSHSSCNFFKERESSLFSAYNLVRDNRLQGGSMSKDAILPKILKLQELAKEEVKRGDYSAAKALLLRAKELFEQAEIENSSIIRKNTGS